MNQQRLTKEPKHQRAAKRTEEASSLLQIYIQRSFQKHYTVRVRHHFTRFQIASVSSPGDCNNLSKKLSQNTLVALFSDLGATGAIGVVRWGGEDEWVKKRKKNDFLPGNRPPPRR